MRADPQPIWQAPKGSSPQQPAGVAPDEARVSQASLDAAEARPGWVADERFGRKALRRTSLSRGNQPPEIVVSSFAPRTRAGRERKRAARTGPKSQWAK